LIEICFVFLDLVPETKEEDEDYDVQAPQVLDDKLDSPSSFYGSLSMADSGFKKFEEDALYPYILPLFFLRLNLKTFHTFVDL